MSDTPNIVPDNSYCCVPQCKSKGSQVPRPSFHRFPNEKYALSRKRRLKWKLILRIGKKITNRMVVCGKHFQPSDFFARGEGPLFRTKLKKNAVPSLNLPISSCENPEKLNQKKQNSLLRLEKIKRREKLVNQSEKVSNSTLIENRRHNVEEFCDSMSDSSTLSASISNEEGIRDCSGVEKNSDIEDFEKTRKKRKVDSPSHPENMLDIPEALSAQNNFDREDIFGHYVVSELRALKDNPLLYLQTKQSILEILTSAHSEYLNPE